ncbi:hypothetical protein ACG33_12465 [Steroidobacter denitrificans]|uniref:Uncharacterized protein n=1 Tax=Steroidobacter denitrificans TaxID=465721 RepID=A0A127FDV6_STEDE|nr:hypothetical protein [Steroidobacter denitrificans]AMN47895.1 hypothetical protein ACG33_12465 [Steroidobacter denitrificans]
MADNTSKVFQAPAVETAGFQTVTHGDADTGATLFVINLCASIAPISTDGRNLPGLENYRLYRVSRLEDGRTRHRLRLGFFSSEAHAENVLALVRQQYPTAFTACLHEEDRKFARGYLAPAGRETVVKPRPAAAPVAAPTAGERPARQAPAELVVTPLQAAGIRPATTRPMRRSPPQLDTTQTIRALTRAELEDEGLEKWFAIQLAASEQPVNLDTMPHLDIFDAYRLYSVASMNAGKIVHSLRLGFFKEDISAEAVGGYLKTFFSTPTVLRVSEAEYTRFKAPPEQTRPAASADIVTLTPARAPRADIPTITLAVPTPDFAPLATGAFESRTGDRQTVEQLDAATTGSFKSGISASTLAQLASRHEPKAIVSARQRPTPSRNRTGMTGKHKALAPRSLSEQLLEEARAVALSESGIREIPKNGSLFSRLVGKLTR